MKSVTRFLMRRDGAATVETVIWFPFFIFIFGLMVDVAMIYNGQARLTRLVQEANREFSVGRLTTTDETETFIEGELAAVDLVGTARTVIIAGVAVTNVELAANQLQLLGFFSSLNPLVLNVSAEHMIENWEV